MYICYYLVFNNIMNLDEKGKELYENYISSMKKWIDYIKPTAYKKFNDYIEKSGKKYNIHEYYIIKYDTNINDQVQSPDIITKYKKLCLLFHPDKFNNTQSTNLFTLIQKLYNEHTLQNNTFTIKLIDCISQYILDTNEKLLAIIITNLSNNDIISNLFTQYQNKLNDENALQIYTILCDEKILFKNENSDIINKNYMDFLDSLQYKFYIDNIAASTIDSMFYTEKQVINMILASASYEQDKIDFYMSKYSDNINIINACKTWYKNYIEKT